uniref:Uncharacterized protein n=1 Tax=Pyrodinium bahamense TaxID=73915 RepID=A0A7S0FFK4_9DINO|mmetsp:Transcript_27895/g.76712  ORF Transcript_27895/g.76712 Transcript_27895/m.76712 type:complete len:277 (+) Transcript_27895:87-917(+)
MSIQDFRETFRRETEHMLARLQRKSFERSRLRSSEASPASTARGASGSPAESTTGPELAHLGELQRLAADMAESVLERVSNKASIWADEGTGGAVSKEPVAASALYGAAEAEAAAARCRLEARRQELEADLQRAKTEEAQVRAELVAKCKAESDLALRLQEERLLELRQSARTLDIAASRGQEAAELQHEFAEHVGRIHSNLALAREAVSRLESRRRNLEKVEGQQSRPLPPMEALLARTAPCDVDAMDELDNPVVEAIRRGEQVCKRMRRSLAGA